MVADVAKDDKTALLADIEDRDKLTFAIRRLFENPTLRQNLITQGLEEVKPYGWEVLIDRYWSELLQTSPMKKALITGITGQDGFFLSRWLLDLGYEVHGFVRRNSAASLGNLHALREDELKRITIQWGDVTDHTIVDSVVREGQYDEIYHLAAQSFVGASFTNPSLTYKTNIEGTLNFVNAIKEYSKHSRFYFAATSELYGKVQQTPQNELTPFYPRSPYGVSKLAGFWTVKITARPITSS